MIATWKLTTSKVYHGLNSTLGQCVHKKTISFAHPDGTDICSGPLTIYDSPTSSPQFYWLIECKMRKWVLGACEPDTI